MKNVLVKEINFLNQMGPEMNQVCLITYLSECLFIPEVIIQNQIKI